MTTRAFLAVIAAVQLAARPAMAQTAADKDNAHHYRGGPQKPKCLARCSISDRVRTPHPHPTRPMAITSAVRRLKYPTTWVRKSKITAAPAATSHMKIAADGQSQMFDLPEFQRISERQLLATLAIPPLLLVRFSELYDSAYRDGNLTARELSRAARATGIDRRLLGAAGWRRWVRSGGSG